MNTSKIIFFIIIGILSVTLAIITFSQEISDFSGGYENYLTYQGDAYTGIQNAAAQTANNVRTLSGLVITLAQIVKFGLGSILLVAGLTLLAVGISPLLFYYNGDNLKSNAKKDVIWEVTHDCGSTFVFGSTEEIALKNFQNAHPHFHVKSIKKL